VDGDGGVVHTSACLRCLVTHGSSCRGLSNFLLMDGSGKHPLDSSNEPGFA